MQQSFGIVFFDASIASGFAQPAGEVLQAFLKAFNSGDGAALETFVKSYDPADTVEGLL